MIIVKTHGGTTKEDVYTAVEKGVALAIENFHRGIKHTVLFFDEANTSDAIWAIKEVVCDQQIRGAFFR